MTEMSPVSHVIPPESTDIPVSPIGVLIPNQEAKLIDVASGTEITEAGPEGVSAPGSCGYAARTSCSATRPCPGDRRNDRRRRVPAHRGRRRLPRRRVLLDRRPVKELIKYKGYQVPRRNSKPPLLHPDIADAAVIGVHDEDGQEIPKAYVVRAPQVSLSEAEVIAHVGAHVAPYKKVRAVQFLEQIPKSSSGKIMRRELRALPTVQASATSVDN